MQFTVKLWGIRGSLPSPLHPTTIQKRIESALSDFAQAGLKSKADVEKFLSFLPLNRLGGYGGNSPCIEVQSDKQNVIIDGGSGIRRLGETLMGGPCGSGKGVVHIFMTHFHWDHLIGLPFFIPI